MQHLRERYVSLLGTYLDSLGKQVLGLLTDSEATRLFSDLYEELTNPLLSRYDDIGAKNLIKLLESYRRAEQQILPLLTHDNSEADKSICNKFLLNLSNEEIEKKYGEDVLKSRPKKRSRESYITSSFKGDELESISAWP